MKVGIIGYGLMGKRRHKVLPAEDQVVIADVDDPIGPACDCDATIVSVPTPNLHAVCLDALAKGATRILLEKPCATTSAEAREILERAEECDAVVVPAYTLRHYPGLREAHRWFEAHGRPMWASAFYGHGGGATGWRAEPAGGGELLDQGSHLLDLGVWFDLGTVRHASLDRCVTKDVEDLVDIRLTHAGLGASWCVWPNVFGFVLTYPEFCIRVQGLGTSYRNEHRFTVYAREDGGIAETREWSPKSVRNLALMNEWSEFLRVYSNARLRDAIRVLELIEEARRCAS